jgi:PAS domain S-box-containing protein
VNLREFRRILRQTLILPVFLLLLAGGLAVWQIVQSSAAFRALDESDRITTEVTTLQKLIIDQETGLRGYQLTGDNAMLQPYREASKVIPRHFSVLSGLLQGRSGQQQRLATLHDRYEVWLNFAEGVLAKHTHPVNDVQLSRQINEQGKELMDGIRAGADGMLAAEQRARKLRSESALSMEHQEFLSIMVGALVSGLLLAWFTRSRLHHVSRIYDTALQTLRLQTDEIYESRQRFQTTLESIGDAVIACDNHGRVQFMNIIAQNLTGWSAQEALGRPLQEVFHIIHEETREIAENPVEKVRRLNRVIGLANHTALISRQGKEYIIDDSAAPIRDAEGGMTGIVLVFRDVTEEKRTESTLVASEKLAVAGRLAASIAHEIHNPLDSVANLLFLIARESDAAKREEYLHLAQQEVGRTMQISRTLLSLYREPVAPIEIDLRDLLDGVLLLLDRRLMQLGVKVEREFPEPLVVEGFPAELRQVFTNVLVNAMDAAGKGGRIRIRIEKAPAQELRGAGAVVEVADSGAGVSEETEKNLFQPFFTTKGEAGTGLGLWVSMGIVQKHGGMIRIRNGKDNYLGAHVRVYLPSKTLASASRRATPHLN